MGTESVLAALGAAIGVPRRRPGSLRLVGRPRSPPLLGHMSTRRAQQHGDAFAARTPCFFAHCDASLILPSIFAAFHRCSPYALMLLLIWLSEYFPRSSFTASGEEGYGMSRNDLTQSELQDAP